ncbi:MAG: hypothetical protein ACREP6_14940, partial [Candidatus Binataceae bacterium]
MPPAAPLDREISRKRSQNSKKPASSNSDPFLSELLHALTALDRGDFSIRLHANGDKGVKGQIVRSLSSIAERSQSITNEISRVERAITLEGRMTERIALRAGGGGWSSVLESMNALISGSMQPTTEVARVISAVAAGDLTQKMALEIDGQPVKGEFLKIGTT